MVVALVHFVAGGVSSRTIVSSGARRAAGPAGAGAGTAAVQFGVSLADSMAAQLGLPADHVSTWLISLALSADQACMATLDREAAFSTLVLSYLMNAARCDPHVCIHVCNHALWPVSWQYVYMYACMHACMYVTVCMHVCMYVICLYVCETWVAPCCQCPAIPSWSPQVLPLTLQHCHASSAHPRSGSAVSNVGIASSSVSMGAVTCSRRASSGTGASGVFQTVIAFQVQPQQPSTRHSDAHCCLPRAACPE